MTFPDGSVFAPNSPFVKQWRISNPDGNGLCSWTNGYDVVWTGDINLAAPEASFDIPEAKPGQDVVISVPMYAPAEPGVYKSIWILRNAKGRKFGDPFWAEVVVREP